MESKFHCIGLSLLLMGLATASPACRGSDQGGPPTAPSAPSTPAAPAPSPPPTPPPTGNLRPGIWVSRDELLRKPQGGASWANVAAAASSSCGTPNLSDQDDSTNTCVLAKAIVYARSNDEALRRDVTGALRAIVSAPPYRGRALALGRELAAYVISADLIDLPALDPAFDAAFRSTIAGLLTTPTSEGPANLVDCHETRPNNWGTHCGASRAAVAAYLGDAAQLARVAKVFRGWLGDRQSYAGFKFGDLAWQCNPSQPVAVNPPGCTKDGHLIDGVLPDDQRRGGGFTWPPPKENYVYEALQGALVQAVILQRAGHDTFSWQDSAILRAFRWLYDQAGFPAAGDDTWEVYLVNAFYGAGLAASPANRPGKNMGFTDFTHGY